MRRNPCESMYMEVNKPIIVEVTNSKDIYIVTFENIWMRQVYPST